ncbi:MAG: hypothetical protein L3K23_02985 [Thermoplasmata archaeon]|nr:hypothetical protein [Thermoplasmata archaeon]
MSLQLGFWAALGALVLVSISAGSSTAHYAPAGGDQFSYGETITVANGTGNYTGYTESTVINGSLGVTAAPANGTDPAYYYNDNVFQNNQGAHSSWVASGRFTFSTQTFHYVSGTENQTGYTNPYVWFFVDNTFAPPASFFLLNSQMTVMGTSVTYGLNTAAGNYVKAIFAEGSHVYQRNDVYGTFTATYDWKAYFDPATGYIIGYVYTEQDTDSAGDGFTYIETLGVTHTSYPLTAASPPPTMSSASGSGFTVYDAVAAGAILVVIVLIVVIARRRPKLAQHPSGGQVTYSPPPVGPAPPPIHLTPSGEPAVQQIVIRETVKVKCQYCGALIDSTLLRCPNCGAART